MHYQIFKEIVFRPKPTSEIGGDETHGSLADLFFMRRLPQPGQFEPLGYDC